MQIRQTEVHENREDPIEKELRSLGYPTEIHSLDGKEDIYAKDIKMGAMYFDNYKKTGKPDILNISCQKGCFNALKVRCATTLAMIISASKQDEEKENAIEVLLNDLDRISNLYWSVGYIHASRILLSLGDYFYKKSNTNRAQIFWEKSASMFYMAKLLMTFNISDHIREVIYKGGDYSSSGFKSVPEAETITTSHLALDDKNRIFTHALNRVNDLIEHHPHHPKKLE